MLTRPRRARRALLPFAGALALGCQDVAAPRSADAPPPPAGPAVALPVLRGDPIPATDRGTFLSIVAARFDDTPMESSANAWAAAAYPPPSPTVGTLPSCGAARQLAQLALAYHAADELKGQANNPPLDAGEAVRTDVATIVATALEVACEQDTPPELHDALRDGAAAYMFAASGGALKTDDLKAAAVIPPGALPGDALVLITPLVGYALPTTLPQGGPYYDFSTAPSFAAFNSPVTVEISQEDPTSLVGDNTILAHVPTGSGSLVPLPAAACSQLGTGTFPVYAATVTPPGVSADPAPGAGTPTVAVAGSNVRCASVNSWSPFGTIQIYRASFPRTLLELHACGTSATGRRFRALNKSGEEVVVFVAGTTNGTSYGKRTPIRLAPGSLASPASAAFELPLGTTAARLYYGPLTVRTTAATPGAPTC